MKSFLYTSLILFVSTQLIGQIDFQHESWKEVLEMAKTENKVVFVDAYAVWCGPCKRMASEVFTQSGVGDFFNENFINAKIDMEKGEGPTIGRKYGVTAYPTLLFIDSNGELLHKAVGYQTADKLINSGNIALRKTNQANEYTTKYEAGERDPTFVLEYMKQLNKADKPAEKVALEYFQEKKDINIGLKAQIAFEALKNMDSQLVQYVMEGKETLRNTYDQSVIDQKLSAAAQNTINTAVEFNAPSVFQQMIKNLKSLDISPGQLRTIERSYYAKVKNDEAFLTSIDEERKDEDADKCALTMEIYHAFPNSQPMLQYARKMYDQSFPYDMSLDNYITGLSLAIGLKDFTYMEQIHATMKMKSNPSPQETQQVEGLYQKAKNYLAQQTGVQKQGN